MKKRALWSFVGDPKRGQLTFNKNDEVLITQETTKIAGWGWGELGDARGFVPLNYFEKPAKAPIAPPRTQAPQPPARGAPATAKTAASTPSPAPAVVVEESTPPPEAGAPVRATLDREAEVLLQWVQGRIPAFHVVDFTTSWRDGHALCGLINALRPGTFDLPSAYKGAAEEDVQMALSAADELLGIAPLLTACDVCSDDTSPEMMALYVKSFQIKQKELLAKADADERQRRRRAAMHKTPVEKPRANEVWCNVTGRTGAFHASISLEGVVTDRFGELLGYIHLDDLKVASPVQELVGYMLADSLYDCRSGSSGVFCGEINRGTGCLHDRNGSTVVALDGSGFCKGPSMDILGAFEHCTRGDLDIVALYCMFVDVDFCDESLYDEHEREPVAAPDSAWTNVYGKSGEFVASIEASEEGRVTNQFGDLIGLVDLDGKRCASADGRLLGYMSGDVLYAAEGDAYAGEIDRGHGVVMAANGSSILSIDATGHTKGATGVFLGEFRGCSYRELDIVALFVVFLSPHFVAEEM